MTRNRRVAVLAVGFFDTFSGYQETVLAAGLREYADVHVVTSNWANPIFSDEHLRRVGLRREYPVGRSIHDGVTIHRLQTLGPPIRGMTWSPKVVSTIRGLDPAGVLVMMPGQLFPTAAVRAAGSAPVVTMYGDNEAMRSGGRLATGAVNAAFSLVKKPLYRYCNRFAGTVLCYTPDTVGILSGISPNARVELLPLSFDQSIYYFDPERRDSIRADLGMQDSEVVVVTSGKFGRQKRLELLVDSVAALRSGGLPVRLIMIGGQDGEYERELSAMIAGLGLQGMASIYPFVSQEDVAGFFNAADVGVWPAKPAVSIQQAMGTGLPVVIPNTPVVSHLLRGTREVAARGGDNSATRRGHRALGGPGGQKSSFSNGSGCGQLLALWRLCKSSGSHCTGADRAIVDLRS